MSDLMTAVERLVTGAVDRVILVAPFVKLGVFTRLLAAIPEQVADIVVVTRWAPAEVAAGVSDPEIVRAAEEDGRVRVLLHHRLHAKIYVSDDRCLVGSANLTSKALGLIAQPNIEVLVELPTTSPNIARVLEALLQASSPASLELAHQVRQQADLMRELGVTASARGNAVDGDGMEEWLPSSRTPGRLRDVYRGHTAGISSGNLEALFGDLAALDIPPGLDEDGFDAAVRARVAEIPEVKDLLARGMMRSAELQDALTARLELTDAVDQASTLATWVSHFTNSYIEPSRDYNIVVGRALG